MLKPFGTLLQKTQAGAAPALLTALMSLFSCCVEDLSLLDDVFAPLAVWCGDRAASGAGSRDTDTTSCPVPRGREAAAQPRGASTLRWGFWGARDSVQVSDRRAVCIGAKGFIAGWMQVTSAGVWCSRAGLWLCPGWVDPTFHLLTPGTLLAALPSTRFQFHTDMPLTYVQTNSLMSIHRKAAQ